MGKKQPGPPDIEALRKRHEELKEKRIRAETELEAARKELEELQAKAREEYDTDDVEKLGEILESMRTDNETMRAAYEKALDGIEADLAKVEDAYTEARESEDT